MKKYSAFFLAIALFYSCKNGNNTSINNTVSADSGSTKQTIEKKANAISAQSIFMLADTFKTQHNNNFVLASLEGKPTVVGMIFTNCGYACPRLTSDMKNIADRLKANRGKVNFLLVSFDSERDTPAQLQKFAKQMELDSAWILLHGSDETVRTLSVLLNVQFEKDAEGNFSHSNLITVLDKQGLLSFQKEGLEADHAETLAKINELMN
ncbi:MAG: SCO family protein [Chitinophagaceae bacterium]|nr:SCO family protein [Chitinophagaceae bacterium]